MVACRSPKPLVKVRVLDSLPNLKKARCFTLGFFVLVDFTKNKKEPIKAPLLN